VAEGALSAPAIRICICGANYKFLCPERVQRVEGLLGITFSYVPSSSTKLTIITNAMIRCPMR